MRPTKAPTKAATKAYVVGAGLAGLAAAVRLAEAGVAVEVSDSAAQAGGRCRSYYDPQLEMTIDNGNHLVLSGNQAVRRYLATVGASDRLAGPDSARFAFVDLRDGARWTLHANDGPLPWWILSAARRVPGTRPTDYLALLALMNPRPGQRVDQAIPCAGPLWERLMGPFLLAALNTDPEAGSAMLAGAVVRETLAKGGAAYHPRIAHPNLAAAFVDPAAAYLARRGGTLRLSRRLKAVRYAADCVEALAFADGEQAVEPGAVVVLATPPGQASSLVPDLTVPDATRAIVNAHFKVEPPRGAEPIVGLIGGLAEWVFAFPGRISVTISGADRLLNRDREDLAERIWAEVALVHGLTGRAPPWQIVKERQATFAATPEQDALRPGPSTAWRNLWLAGDWTQTGLPATIEGAIRSGFRAADLAMAADLGIAV